MPIRMTCPHCKGVIEAKEALLGAQARCPYCRNVVKVEPAPAVLKVEPRSPEGERRPQPPPAPAARPEAPAPREAPKDPALAAQKPPEPPVFPEFPGGAPARDNGAPRPGAQAPAPVPQHHVTLLPDEPSAPPGRGREGPAQGQAPEPGGSVVGLVLGTHERRKRRSRLAALLQSLRHSNPTDASALLTAGAAVVVTVLFYLLLHALPPLLYSDVGVLLTKRTWVVHFTIFLTVWAAAIMLVKFWKLSAQQAALSYDVLPPDPAVKIYPGNARLVEDHVRKLPVDPRKSFLINRVLLALENFQARKSVPEVGEVLKTQADTDAAKVDSSYTMLKVLIWGIPILGFIGTVVGISDAVSGFTHSVQAAQDLDVVRGALGKVTEGLAVAFDTTFIGLVLSIFVMFATNSLQKAEDDTLIAVDQYCTANLLPRLATEEESRPAGRAATEDGAHLAAMNAQLAALQEWQKRLENLETALLERVVDTLSEVRKELANKPPVPQEAAR
jgi:biopolymer transport protein ExbB/TolQ